jgi:hypothetical protein
MASSGSRRRWRITFALSAAALCALALIVGARPSPRAEQGQRLFDGELTLTARMAGHEQVLPQQAVACSNCHEREGAASRDAQSFGTVLGPRSLVQPVARRGGPASRYTLPSLCRVLRDGIDPAHVMIPQTMPRYGLSDEQCAALWQFLTEK